MNTPPDLDHGLIIDALREQWSFRSDTIAYAAVGFGSHHWIATDRRGDRRFVTVDEPSRRPLTDFSAAFETARRLADIGFEFVLAPTRTTGGAVVHPLTERFTMTVFPFVEGKTGVDGQHPSEAHRAHVRTLVARLHTATDTVGSVARTDDLLLPHRDSLDPALEWEPAGPFAQAAHDLFHEIDAPLRAGLEAYDRLAEVVRESCEWVITHGEPHGSNVLWTTTGPLLIDWDTTALGPAARDLWMLFDATAADSPDVRLYRLWWELAEIGCYIEAFRLPHTDTADARESWENLLHYAAMIAAR